jgi:hypothetical protein
MFYINKKGKHFSSACYFSYLSCHHLYNKFGFSFLFLQLVHLSLTSSISFIIAFNEFVGYLSSANTLPIVAYFYYVTILILNSGAHHWHGRTLQLAAGMAIRALDISAIGNAS